MELVIVIETTRVGQGRRLEFWMSRIASTLRFDNFDSANTRVFETWNLLLTTF